MSRENEPRFNREDERIFPVSHAIILAGGSGSRLGFKDRPKPMAQIGDKPIFAYQLHEIQRAGIENVIFAVGFKHEVLVSHVGTGERYGIKAIFSIEDETVRLGTGGAIKKALKELPKNWENVLVTNGDNLWYLDLRLLIKEHIKKKVVATIVILHPTLPYGIVKRDEETGLVTTFIEKPKMEDYWINAGIYVFSNEIENFLPDKGDIEKETFPKLAESGKVFS